MRRFLTALLTVINVSASAADQPFEPKAWSKGLHLLAGTGASSSYYHSTTDKGDWGAGFYFKTDLSYFFNDRFALEWSSGLKFNQVDEFLVWDTLFSIGARYRIPYFPITKSRSTYVRAFIGRSPTVIFLNGKTPPEYQGRGIERIHFDGPLAGASLGTFQMSEKGFVWFSEVSFTVQRLEQQNGIRMQGEVPIVIFEGPRTDRSTIYSLYFAIGTIFF